jgi:hypothetical protein
VWWVQNTARHHIVPPRFKHQTFANPIKFGQKMLAFFAHVRPPQYWAATCHYSNRIAAGVGIYAEESFVRHGFLLLLDYFC